MQRNVKFFDLDLQYKLNKKKITSSILRSLDTTNFILGKDVGKFEKKIGKISETKYAVGTSSGTDSLLLSLMSLNVKRGDEVITSGFSWISVLEVILILGAKPVFVDINLNDFNICVEDLKKKISKKTKVIVTTSLFGCPCDIDKIKKLTGNKISIIEDSAQSFGSSINNKKLSNYADIITYSFFPSKILGAYGDAGGIATNKKNIYKKLIKLRNHGQTSYNNAKTLGINGRLDTIQASILLEKVKFFKKEIKIRKKIAKKYIEILKKNKISGYTKVDKHKNHVYGNFSILVKNRNKLIKILSSHGIPIKIYYTKPLYKQFFQKNNIFLKNVEFCCKHIISLPINIYSNKSHKFVCKYLHKVSLNYEKYFFKEKKIINFSS